MEPLEAVRVGKLQRTSSVPCSLTRAAYRRSLPRSLVDALYGGREKFESYKKKPQPGNPMRHIPEMISIGTQTVETIVQQEDQKQQPSKTLGSAVKKMVPSNANAKNGCSGSTERGSATDVNPATSNTITADTPTVTLTDTNTNTNTTTTTTTNVVCIPYDPEITPLAMKRKKHVVDHCPEKIAVFLKNLCETVAKAVAEAPPRTVSAPTASSAPSATVSTKPKGGGGGGGGGSQYNSRTFDALKELWEDRRDAPITVSTALGRQRGLFGGVERKELHHLVISILNRVSNDAEKYREVKNELLRLPIPEANDATLAKIVNVFFTKAVREQHFSSSYADLVAALCKVPEGQRIIGDKAQSLEYRLRQQLLHRCQAEFRQLEEQNIERAEQGGEDRTTQFAEESFKERRDRVCGIVQFVGQLYLRHIVTEKVIEDILVTSCAGLYRREGIRVPPPYVPTEAQMDETITLLAIVDNVFFRTALGSDMLPEYTKLLEYWSTHHPVPRIRFLLLSVIERLHKILADRNAALAAASQQQQQQSLLERPSPSSQSLHPTPQSTPRPQQSSSPPPQQPQQSPPQPQSLPAQPSRSPTSTPNPQSQTQQQQQQQQQQQVPPETRRVSNNSVPMRPLGFCSEDGSFASTGGRNAMAASTDMSPKAKPLVFVGGRPIPAPRSAASRHSSLTLGASVNSIASSSDSAVKQLATTENVARYMQTVSNSRHSVDEVTEEIMNNFVSVTSVVEVWTERCLRVVKAVRDRAVYGAFLAALNRYHKNTLRGELRRIAMSVFIHAVREKLHEDLALFRYWTEMICSDTTREVLDEGLLNEALQYLLENDTTAVRLYLRDVARQMNTLTSAATSTATTTTTPGITTAQGSAALTQQQQQQQQPQWVPSDEGSHFVRYRPLHVVHHHNVNRKHNFELNTVNFPDVRLASVEIDVFCALLTGTPSKERLFDTLRASPRLRSPLVAPEVLSAILHAELCTDTTAFVEDNLDLLSLVSDGAERETREILLVAELYHTLKNDPAEASWPLSAGSRVMAKLSGRIISDETRLRAQKYFAPRDEHLHHYIGTQPVQLQLRQGGNNNNNNNNNSGGVGVGNISSSSSNNNIHGNSNNTSHNNSNNVSATRRTTVQRR